MNLNLRLSLKNFGMIILLSGACAQAAQFTPLIPIPAPEIESSAAAYPGGSHGAGRLLDGDAKTEYAANGGGGDLFVEFRFPKPVRVAGFRHVDRNAPATIAAAKGIAAKNAGASPIRSLQEYHRDISGA